VTPRVLFVSHTAQISGGERSLLELLAGLRGRVEAIVATPEGELADAVRALGVPARAIPGTAGSLKLHPVHTPRTGAELIRAAAAVRRLGREERADLAHANSIRAGLVAGAAARAGGAPAVVHIRDVLPPGPVTRATRAAIAGTAAAIVANSEYALRHFVTGRPGPMTGVAHSPVDLERLEAAAGLGRDDARTRLGLPPGDGPVLGVVAQLTPWKAQDDAVRIAAGLRAAHPGVRLVLVGSAKFVARATRHDNQAFVRGLEALIDDLGMGDRVHFLGERADVPEVLRALDLLLLPSWEEPFGRAVVEGLASGVPVAATAMGGPPEIIRDGVEGLLLPPREPEAWITALAALLGQPERLAAMARAGRERARAFGRDAHAERMLAIYGDVLSSARPR
jgi:glycosyltransferase involved in cell wall biosynthesis